MKKIILVETSAPHWLSAAAYLRSEGISVCYWTGWFRIADEVRAQFPEAVFHDTFLAKIARDPHGKSIPGSAFDDACHRVWGGEAQTVYDMMNRFDYSRDQSFVERSTLFYEHLVYWRSVLHKQAPDLVVFATPPHVVFDYVLLALCRELGVGTLMFEEATVYPPYCLAMTDYRQGSTSLARAARHRHVVSEASMSAVNRMRADYRAAIPAREVVAKETMERAIREGTEGLLARAKVIKEADIAANGQYGGVEVNVAVAYKEAGKSLRESFKGAYASSRYMDQLVADRAVTDSLRSFYNANLTAIGDIGQPFVYVALAGQPERTSNPQAGTFANQILLVNVIAQSLPEGWLLLVKEHPNQFHPEFAVNMCRDLDYYRSLLAIPGVRFLSTSTDPFLIIDRAQAVATTGGTSAVEAVARGTPALLFGDAWYRDCPGVIRVRDAHEAAAALKQIAAGISIPAEDFENYMEAIARGCFRGLGDYPPDGYPIDAEENARNLCSIIRERLS